MEKGNAFLIDTKSICFMCFREKRTKTFEKIGKIEVGVKEEGDPKKCIIKEDTVGVLKPSVTCRNTNNVKQDACDDSATGLHTVSEPEVKVKSESAANSPNSDDGDGENDDNDNKGPVKEVEIKKLPAGEPEIEDSCELSFRVLTRYLKINLQKVFSLNVPIHSLHLLDKTELTVSLCSKCGLVASSFVKLCQELDLIQMKIQGCIRKVHDVIEDAENDKTLVDNYRKLMVTPNPLDLIQAGIVDNLRKEILEKCQTKLQKAYPRVRLEKVNLTSAEKVSSVVPKIDIPKLDLTAILTEETYLESIRRSASVIFTSSMKAYPDQSPMKGNHLQLETVIAPPSDPNSIEDMEIIQELSEDIEMGIPDVTPPPISSSSLPSENGLLLDTLSSEGNIEPAPFEDEDIVVMDKVSSPPTQHQQAEESDVKEDYVKLCKRIIKGQPKFYCELCNQRVNSKEKHKRVVHREGLLRCFYCDKGFSEYRERKLHTLIQHHYEKFLLPLRPSHISEEQFKETTEACFGIISGQRKDFSCPICSKSHRKTNNLRGHVIGQHFEVYKEKLDELLKLNSAQHNKNANSLLHGTFEFKSSPNDDSGLEVIAVVEKTVDTEDSILDQSLSLSQDLSHGLLSDFDFTLNSSAISDGSQSPALSQQQSQMEVEKEDEDEEGSAGGNKGQSKYIVIAGRKADGRPLYFCNLCKKSVTNTIMHKRIHHGEKLLHCKHCNKEVTTAYILRAHTAKFHPQHLFESVKDPNCGDDQFLKIVDSLISDLTKKGDDLKGPGVRQKCPLCMKECKQKGRWFLHLIEQHFEDLSQRLKDLQREELGSQSTTTTTVKADKEAAVQQVILVQFQSPPPNSTNETKNLVKQPASTPSAFHTSPITQTPPPSSPTKTPKSEPKSEKKSSTSNQKKSYSEKHRFICDACGSRFTQSSSLKRHEKLYCKVNKSQETSTTEENGEVEYHPLAQSCTVSQDSSSTIASTSTLTLSSGMSTTEQVEPVPLSSSLAEGLSTIDTSSLNWSIASNSGGGSLGCSYCDKTFMFPYCQRTHLITAHRVETFSEHVPIGTSYEEVETVLGLILQDFNKLPNGMNSCNFCAKEYAQVTELESHVLISHFDDVVTKLKHLVQLREELILNPNFGASFDNFNLLSEDCIIDNPNDEGLVTAEAETENVADVQIFDLDQFPELREIYSSLAGSGSGGDAGGVELGGGAGPDQDGIGIGIEQVISAGSNNDIADQLFF